MNYPKINNEFSSLLDNWMPHYGITTKLRKAHFLAQVAHESSCFERIEENLNYSATALVKIFPSRFTKEDSLIYQRKPEMIANKAYANRYGNGDEQSGDGWKYRGRGGIQITFKDNYKELSTDWNIDVLSDPDMLLLPDYAVRSACWFWWTKGLNRIADAGTVKDVTKKINPALVGLKERQNYFTIYQKYFL